MSSGRRLPGPGPIPGQKPSSPLRRRKVWSCVGSFSLSEGAVASEVEGIGPGYTDLMLTGEVLG